MTIIRRFVASLVWFFGGLFGIDSILSVPEHDVSGRQTTVEVSGAIDAMAQILKLALIQFADWIDDRIFGHRSMRCADHPELPER